MDAAHTLVHMWRQHLSAEGACCSSVFLGGRVVSVSRRHSSHPSVMMSSFHFIFLLYLEGLQEN